MNHISAMRQQSFYLVTLGCKVNQYESHSVREAWICRGWKEAAKPEEAGYILVNSCAVTAKAVADTRNAVRRMHRAAPRASIIVTGCAAQVMHDELSALPGVLRVLPQSDKERLLAWPEPLPQAETFPAGAQRRAFRVRETRFPVFSVSGYDRSRAVLKIQDGCSHGCAYCIVPLTRGGARSRSYSESLAEARRLLRAGFREIVISGVNLRQYHQDGGDFWDFLKAFDAALSPEWAGTARLRISSLEPGQLTGKALEILGRARMLAPHLHLSLQSGSPSVLRRMGRGHYDPGTLPLFLERLGKHWPYFGLGADILTGFPGETEEEFAEGLRFCRSLPLTYAHVFPYSRRPGTGAAAMPGQIGSAVKKERAALLRDMIAEKKQAFLQSLLAVPGMRVVFENRQTPLWRGVNEYYADCRLAGHEELEGSHPRVIPGDLTRVRAVRLERGELLVVPD